MQQLLFTLAVFLLTVAPVAAKVVVDEPASGVATPAAGEGAVAGQRQAPAVAPKGRPSQVGVRLDALEAMERLQELRIKRARRTVAEPAEPSDDTPLK
jgi:hypothetical protein